jgi:hypothetical protein
MWQHPAKVMIWEDRPLDSVTHKLGDLGVDIVVFDPCGDAPAEGDFLGTQRKNLSALAEIDAELP